MRYFSNFRFDDTHKLLWREGIRVPLTAKACGVLSCLIDSAGRPLGKDEILAKVWGPTHVASDNIKVLVREIRHALGDDAYTPTYIRTLPRNGYEFVARVTDTPPSLGGVGERVFVGRAREMEAIERALDRATTGTRGFIMVNGAAGLGKTALFERALRSAVRKSFVVARGQCFPTSNPSEPYAPILDAIHRLIGDVPRVRDIIRPHAPELLQHLDTPIQASDAMRSPRLLREIVAAVEALANDTPTVLALEDVYWLDQASIDALGALARRRQRARLLLLVTCRPLEAFADAADLLRRLIDELEMARAGNLIRLDSLTRLEVEQYASKRFSPEVAGELGGLLHSASGGRPLLLTAVTNAVVARGVVRRTAGRWSLVGGSREVSVAMVGAIGGFLERQIAQLSRGDRALLTSVSALGLEFSIWKAARITGRDPASVEQVLDRLARSGDVIVRADGRHTLDALATYRFTHPMYLEVLNSTAVLSNVS